MKNYFLNRAERPVTNLRLKTSDQKGFSNPFVILERTIMVDSPAQPQILKRKFRWGCKAKDETGKILFEGFVKVSSRPQIEFEETEILVNKQKTWIPGKTEWQEITLTVCDVNEDFNVQGTKNVEVTLYDGAGTPIEHWDLQNISKMSLTWDTVVEEMNVDWTLKYTNAQYHSISPKNYKSPE